ncbi:MAG: carboxypeptidase regulatory-like domain-containing protein [Deltaproteobacteria bacterium]|nr:carboxypeptidase regulatory-like domain-containing protein [Deltaproteobacteria bacterium]
MALLLAACIPSVAPTNPYDPSTPVEQQARATLSGVVYDYLGAPLRNAVVKLEGPTVPVNSPLTTDDDGAFNFGELIPGAYTLDVKHPNHLRQIRDLLLSAGEARDLAVELEAVPSVLTGEVGHITGTVQKAGELALPAAAQDHSGITVEVVGVGTRTTTSSAGRFDIYLAPGTYSLGLSASNYKSETVANLVVVNGTTTAASATPIVLLANPGSISGSVTLEGAGMMANSGIAVSLDNTASTATTDDSGAFVIDGVAAGSYTLRATKAGFDTRTISGVSVRGGVQTAVDAMQLAIARGKLTGKVTLQGAVGGDNSGAVVSIASTTYTAVSASSGDFEISGVPAGTYSVSVAKENYASQVLANQVVVANQSSSTSPATIVLVRQSGSFALEGGAAYSNLTGTASDLSTRRRARISLLEAPNGSVVMKLSGSDVHSWKVGSNYYAPGVYTLAAGDGIPAVNSGSSATWLDVFFTGNVALPADDGAKSVTVTFSSDNGTTVTGSFSTSIIADVTPPVVTASALLLDGGAAYTGDDTITASLSATDATSGVAQYRLWNGAAGATLVADPMTTPVAIAAAVTQDLDPGSATPPDGSYEVSVRFFDNAGNASSIVRKSILLDQVAPAGSASIVCPSGGPTVQAGFCWTSSVSVDLALTDAAPSSGLALMQIVNGLTFGFESYSPYEDPTAHTLSPGDGTQRISVRVKDGAGKTLTLTDAASVTVDASPAQSVVVTLTGTDKSGASTTLTRDRCVSVTINASEANPHELRVSNSSDFSGATAYSVASFPVTPTFTGPELGACSAGKLQLPVPAGGEQNRAVWVQVTDKAGNQTVGFGSIQVDRQPPLLTSAAFSDVFTTSTSATLAVTASGASEVRVSGTNAQSLVVSNGVWQSYTVSSVPVVFSDSTQGTKSVDVSVRDEAGNETSLAMPATIVLDTSAPTAPSALIVNGKAQDATCDASVANDFHRTQVPLIQFTSTDAQSSVAFYRMSENALFSDASWQVYPGPAVPVPFTLSSGDGNKTIYVETQNGAGTSSASAASICIIFDTVPPGSLSLTPTGSDALGYSADADVTFSLSAYDDGVGGVTGLKYSIDQANSICAGAAGPTDWASSIAYTFTWPRSGCPLPGEGPMRLAVRAIDPAGNVSDPVLSTVIKDSVPPTQVNIAYLKSHNKAIEASWTASTELHIDKYRLHFESVDAIGTTGPTAHTGVVDVAGSSTFAVITGPNNDGTGLYNFYDYKVWIEAIDLAGLSSVTATPGPGDADFGQTSVGWTLKEVATASSGVIEPQQVVYRDGKIYALYNEASTATADLGSDLRSVRQAVTRLAVSADGGDTWRYSVVGSSTPSPGRISAVMSVIDARVSVVTVLYDANPAPAGTSRLVEYVSDDDGSSWQAPQNIQRVLPPAADPELGSPFGQALMAEERGLPLALAGPPNSRTLLFGRRDFPLLGSYQDHVYATTQSDPEGGWAPVAEPTPVPPFTQWLDTDVLRISACNANMIDRAVWKRKTDGHFIAARSPFHGKRWDPSSDYEDLSALTYSSPPGDLAFATLACSPLGGVTWFYVLALSQAGEVFVKARTDTKKLGDPDAIAPAGFDRLLEGGNPLAADASSTLSGWAGHSNLFMAFKRGGAVKGLGVAVASHLLPTPVTLVWRVNTVDVNQDAGVNPVITGADNSSPVIAYTDQTGQHLKLARAASLVPQPTPLLLDGATAYRWSPSPGAAAYQVTTESACTGPPQKFGTTNTQLTNDPGALCVSVKAIDANGLTSEPGAKWRLGSFSAPVTVGNAAINASRMTSARVGLYARDNAVAALGDDGSVYYSNDGGQTFSSSVLAGGMGGLSALAGSSDGSNAYVHVLYRQFTGPSTTALQYKRGTYANPAVAGGSWVWSAATPLLSESDPVQDLAEDGRIVIKTKDARLDVAFLFKNDQHRSVHVLESPDHGQSWNAVVPALPAAAGPTGPTGTTLPLGAFDFNYVGSDILLFIVNPQDATQPSISHARLSGAFLEDFSDLCATNPAMPDYCGRHASHLVSGTTPQFIMLGASVTDQVSPKASPSLRLAAGALGFGSLFGPDRALAWRMATLASSFQVAAPADLDMVSSDANPSGVWQVDATCASGPVGARWDLNLRFCERACQTPESWSAHVLHSTTASVCPDQESAHKDTAYTGLRIAADAAKRRLHVLFTNNSGQQKLMSGGFIAREQ